MWALCTKMSATPRNSAGGATWGVNDSGVLLPDPLSSPKVFSSRMGLFNSLMHFLVDILAYF